MCFSASASFAASGGLAVIGGASLVIAQKEDKIVAAIPLLFAIQQAFEGIQWLYLYSSSYSLLAAYGYLFFTFVVWPIYVPSFVYLLDTKRRNILKYFILLGATISTYSLFVLFTESLGVSALKGCVSYTLLSPSAYIVSLSHLVTAAYIFVILGPLLISSRRVFQYFGMAIFLLAIIAWFFYTSVFVSVWCFFAAIVSAMFFVYIESEQKGK
jgi:hypothetical protein